MLPLFDLHCDTFLELYKSKQDINNNSLHISLKKASAFSPYIQVCAIWSDYHLSNNEAYDACLRIIEYIKSQGISFVGNLSKLSKNNFLLAIEDARILNNDLFRLDTLYSLGVRVLTLNWKGESCIGGGWDTNTPLTEFGKEVVKRCKSLGIIVDLSHSSCKAFDDAIALAKKLNFTPIASHSNSYSLLEHKRNLTDNQFKKLCELNSLIGISFVPEHLGNNTDIYTILRHINHFLKLGGESNIALGSDFDGVNSLPYGICSIESLKELYELFIIEFGESITKKIFFENAYSFFKKNL